MSLTSDAFSRSIVLTTIPLEELKFVYSVPQIVDPDPITCIIEPTHEEGGIYVGGYEGAKDLEMLKRLKIRAVLTASQETAVQYSDLVVQFHHVVQAHDKDDYNILQFADQTFDFIERHRKHTNILVHCFLGISRSPTIVVAYLMKKYNLNIEKALWKLKSKRRQVNPNTGFLKQLLNYEKLLQQQQQQQQQQQLQQQKPKGIFKMVRQQAIPQTQMLPQSRILPMDSRVIIQKSPSQYLGQTYYR
ncbi:unnamed protein product [Paramecium pentaurelia]|uniref:protein-tyrosine-phosphatase n=1 Tax=Paramecium pentaurelia TaxID=43138 RepID=A0A8S1TVB1_9CILI|nr:unnamed protein product [Paramecium pentaurelia]